MEAELAESDSAPTEGSSEAGTNAAGTNEAGTDENAAEAITDTEIAAVVEPVTKTAMQDSATLTGTGEDVVASGTCGDNATWTLTGLTDALTLTISGSGEMYEYTASDLPWKDYVSNIKSAVVENKITSITDNAFSGCDHLVDVSLSDKLTEIGDSVFFECTYLSSISIPEDVTQIGDNAFNSCESLTNISIPDGVTNIGRYAFAGCNGLNSVTLPDGITQIENGTFYYCSSLSNITMPSDVTSIGSYAFYNCNNLAGINLPDAVESIGKSAFAGCSEMIEIILPDGITQISDRTFANCSSLAEVILPSGLESIGDFAFYDCSCLTDLELPETVTSIGGSAFEGCHSLTDITIPDGVTRIDASTFFDCYKLNNIIITDSVRSIADDAFSTNRTIRADVYTVTGSTADEYFSDKNDDEQYFFTLHYLYDNSEGPQIYQKTKRIVLQTGDIADLEDFVIATDDSCLSSIAVTDYDDSIIDYDNRQLAAIIEGSTSITVTYNDTTFTIPVDIVESTTDATGISFDPANLTMQFGEKTNLLLDRVPEVSVIGTPEWSSSNPEVVSVDQNGMMRALETGSAIITVNAGGLFATCEITVVKNPSAIVAFDEVDVERGESQKLYCHIYPAGSADASQCSFESEDTGIAEVSDDGVVTAKVLGTTNVIITLGELSKTVSVRVTAKLNSISIPTAVGQLNVNDTVQLTVSYDPEDTTDDKTVQWMSNNENVATVDENGLVTACGIGNAIITAIVGDHIATCTIVCAGIPLTGIELPEEMTAEYGKELNPEVTYVPEDATDDKTATWSSSNTDIFTVSEDGVITPMGIGTATLTAAVGALTATSEVTVVKGIPEYEEPETIEAVCGQTLADLTLPDGFAWQDPEESAGSAGANSFTAVYTPDDTDHYNAVDNVTVTVNVSHAFSTEWSKGTATHWHECACGAKADETGHTYGDWEVAKEATCTESGEMQRTCTVCGEIETVEYAARGHVWNKDYTVDKEAISTEAGSESIHCAVCDAIKEGSEREIPVVETVKIVTQPADAEVMSGDQAVFTVVAEGNNLKYQWQYNTGGTYWGNCKSTGFNTDTFSFVMNKKYAGRRYRCIVTSGEVSVISDIASLGLKQAGWITLQPVDADVAIGETASFHVEAEGNDLSYQWQYNISGTYWSNCTGKGYDTDTFSFTMQKKYAGRRYRCVVMIGEEAVISDAARVNLEYTGEITEHPADTAVAEGETASFHVGFTGGDPAYQWQWSADGTKWTNCKSASYNMDTFSFTMQSRFAGRYYRCVIKDGKSTVYSESGQVTTAD